METGEGDLLWWALSLYHLITGIETSSSLPGRVLSVAFPPEYRETARALLRKVVGFLVSGDGQCPKYQSYPL
jgi:hypothetical protein